MRPGARSRRLSPSRPLARAMGTGTRTRRLRADFAAAEGRPVMAETTAEGYGQGGGIRTDATGPETRAPRTDAARRNGHVEA